MNQIDQLGKIKALLDSGAIDQNEFQKLKNEVLNQSIERGIPNSINEPRKASPSSNKKKKVIGYVSTISVISLIVILFIFFTSKKVVFVPYLKTNGKFVYVDSSSMKQKIDNEYDECRLFSEELAAVKVDGKWGFIDKVGKQVIGTKYEECADFNEGYASFKYQDKWGFIDINGQEMIPAIYYNVESFSNGLARVSLMNPNSNPRILNGFIDKSGKEIIPMQNIGTYTEIHDGLLGVGFADENMEGYHAGYFNMKGERVTSFEYNNISAFSEGLALVAKGTQYTYKSFEGKWGFIDASGEIKIPLIYDDAQSFQEGLAAINSNGKWGFIDKKGYEVIPTQYEFVSSFSEGLAAVIKPNEKAGREMGFIDKTGMVVINFKYEGLEHNFKDGVACVNLGNNKKGYIDKEGNELTSQKYDHGEEFIDGFAMVGVGQEIYGSDGYVGFEGKWGVINKKGEEIVPLIYDEMNNVNGTLYVTLNGSKFYIDKNNREYREK